MKASTLTLLLALAGATALHGAMAELNIAEGSIEAPDGSFIGRDYNLAKDFRLELLYVVPSEQGSWLPLSWDNKGRLLVSSHNSNDVFRLTVPKVGSSDQVRVERIDGLEIGAAHGLLYAFDSLYINVDEGASGGGGGGASVGRRRNGIYRITDTNKDDTWDKVSVIRNILGSGQHGTHTLKLSPDGQYIHVISGDDTPLPTPQSSRVPPIWGEDDLIRVIPTNFNDYQLAPQATSMRFDQAGNNFELWAMGMRNPVDQAFNKDGELFTYDSDMEADMGNNFYRPTSVYHLVSGGDMGYRLRASKRPRYYIDNLDTVVAIGSGSPTGVFTAQGAKFPARYQDALFAADWSYGNLWAVSLTPEGATYKGEAMPFISGRPFNVTNGIVNPADNSMLVITGGNGQSQLFRVTYTGAESTAPTKPDTSMAAARDTRKSLEKFHGKADAAAVNTLWPYLSDADRYIRYAARTALEWQPVAGWRERALTETDPRKSIAAMVSLARLSGKDEYHRAPTDPAPDLALEARMIAALDRIDWNSIGYQDKLDLLRAYSLVFIRLAPPDEATRQRLIAKFDPYLPAAQRELNWELAEMLIYLGAPSAPEKVMALIRNAPSTPFYPLREYANPILRARGNPGATGPAGASNTMLSKQEDQEQYVMLLRTAKTGWTKALREEFFRTIPAIAASARGNLSAHLGNMRADAISQLSEAEKAELADVLNLPIGGGRGGGGGGGAGGGRGGAAPGGAPGAAPAAGRGAP
jgi:hypothetical protein